MPVIIFLAVIVIVVAVAVLMSSNSSWEYSWEEQADHSFNSLEVQLPLLNRRRYSPSALSPGDTARHAEAKVVGDIGLWTIQKERKKICRKRQV